MRKNALFSIFFCGLGYWLLGHASNVLAIPPGFASPIWPAAGFALMCVTQWSRWASIGVFAASFLLNLHFANASITSLDTAWLSSAVIAFGSSCQVLLAHTLICRVTVFPGELSKTRDTAFFGLLAGPASCVASASIGVTTLWYSNIINTTEYLQNWFNWWIGDSIGVMLFAPIILLFNIEKFKGRSLNVFGFLGVYLLLTSIAVGTFLYAKHREKLAIDRVLHEQTIGLVSNVTKQLDSASDTGQSVVAFFKAIPNIEHHHFAKFAESIFSHIPGTQAISWIPIIEANQRTRIENSLRDIGGELDFIYQRNEIGDRELAAEKRAYYPVYYIYPLESNRVAVGFDLSSHPKRKETIQAALSSRTPVMTLPITLVQETENQKSFLYLCPVIEGGTVKGFVSNVYRINDLIMAAIDEETLNNYDIQILIDGEPALSTKVKSSNPEYHYVYHIDFAHRDWEIALTPTKALSNLREGKAIWFILVFAFLLVIVLGILALMIISRTVAIESEVKKKTLALQAALKDAEESNKVKVAFLATMSHELRTPLNSIIGYSRRITKGLSDTVEPKYIAASETILNNGLALLNMINDILDLSKVEAGKMSLTKQNITLADFIENVLTIMRPAAESKNLELTSETPPVKTLHADSQRLSQILLNLITNAIKFTDKGSVNITFNQASSQKLDYLCICVNDTGGGISLEDQQRLFRRYEQLGDTFQGGQMGTGLGLALVQELVELHDGKISVESKIGRGSTFKVCLPLN